MKDASPHIEGFQPSFKRAMTDPATRRPALYNRDPLPGVARIVAVASGKGGVGKSTVTVNLAHALTQAGQRVGILDADLYGPSIPRMLALDTRLRPEIKDGLMLPPVSYGIKAMSISLLMGDQAAVLRAPMVTKALAQMLRGSAWGPLDTLLIDLPPGTGDIHLSLAQSVPITGALIVSTPQDIATIDAEKSAVMFQKLDIPILGIIENMSYFADPAGQHHRLFGEGGGEKLAAKFDTELLAQLPMDPALRADADAGQNHLNRNTAVAELFRQLAGRL